MHVYIYMYNFLLCPKQSRLNTNARYKTKMWLHVHARGLLKCSKVPDTQLAAKTLVDLVAARPNICT